MKRKRRKEKIKKWVQLWYQKTCKRPGRSWFSPLQWFLSILRVRRKSFGYHPQILNQWWARRPLAACRAMLLTLLLPDPCDPNCTEEFKIKARELLFAVYEQCWTWRYSFKKSHFYRGLSGILLTGIMLGTRHLLELGVAWLRQPILTETPLVSQILLRGEAQYPLERHWDLFAETFASDLNPVACLIFEVMLEDIPGMGQS